MATLLYLPAWSVGYSYGVDPSQTRTRVSQGFKRQAKDSHRHMVIADVTRKLQLSELPYFEWFVRGLANSGADKFTDSFIDHDGLQTGLIRIVNGEYSVNTDTRSHLVSCQIEIFR